MTYKKTISLLLSKEFCLGDMFACLLCHEFLLRHQHVMCQLFILNSLRLLGRFLVWPYPAQAPSNYQHKNHRWQKKKLDHSVSYVHGWVVEHYTISALFLERFYRKLASTTWWGQFVFMVFWEANFTDLRTPKISKASRVTFSKWTGFLRNTRQP